MDSITIVIPTRNRYEKLIKTLESIPDLSYVKIIVICDGEDETRRLLEKEYIRFARNMDVWDFAIQAGAVRCRNHVIQRISDGVLYATDDITFQEGAIESAFHTFNKNFPDDDGVVGFVQIPGSFDPTGVALVGQKFLHRYPEKKLFFPGYFHFSSQEVHRLCERIEYVHHGITTFVQDKNAVVEHLHPGKFKDQMDQTHLDARIFRSRDLELSRRRKKDALVWGNV